MVQLKRKILLTSATEVTEKGYRHFRFLGLRGTRSRRGALTLVHAISPTCSTPCTAISNFLPHKGLDRVEMHSLSLVRHKSACDSLYRHFSICANLSWQSCESCVRFERGHFPGFLFAVPRIPYSLSREWDVRIGNAKNRK